MRRPANILTCQKTMIAYASLWRRHIKAIIAVTPELYKNERFIEHKCYMVSDGYFIFIITKKLTKTVTIPVTTSCVLLSLCYKAIVVKIKTIKLAYVVVDVKSGNIL